MNDRGGKAKKLKGIDLDDEIPTAKLKISEFPFRIITGERRRANQKRPFALCEFYSAACLASFGNVK